MQLNQLKSGMKNSTEVTLNLSSTFLVNCRLLLTNKPPVSKLRKAFVNNSSAETKLFKTRIKKLHKIGQSRGFLGSLLGPLLKNCLSLMKNVLKALAKSVLIPLGLAAASSATDAAIHEKIFGSSMTTLITSNEEKNDIVKIVHYNHLKNLVYW